MIRNLADVVQDMSLGKFSLRIPETTTTNPKNRLQSQGSKLEEIVKDFLSGITLDSLPNRESLYEKYLSYQGAANNPPDAMFRGGDHGDAFEIKKVEKPSKAALELNSSYPYSNLKVTMSRLTSEARQCETWAQRDIFYVIGNMEYGRDKGNWAWFVQGSIFAQKVEHFENIENSLKPAITDVLDSKGLTSSQTNELGRANDVDLLGLTSLRIRGMWTIENPTKVFSELQGVQENLNSNLVIHILILTDKWKKIVDDFEKRNGAPLTLSPSRIAVTDVKVPSPDDINLSLNCKLLRFEVL